ncbi:hypothetical protein BSKO_10838 [Bryopsis sp. KO-2023]|nr:hypothetical protein BSKO_10838 [Bryopsis sp. KO-2023]
MPDAEEFEWVDKLKVLELKKELRSRRESMSGRKAELQQRLKERLKHDCELEVTDQNELQQGAGEDVSPMPDTVKALARDAEEKKTQPEKKNDEGTDEMEPETAEPETAEPEKEATEKSEEKLAAVVEDEPKTREPEADDKKEEEEKDSVPPEEPPAKSDPPEKPVDAEPEIDDILGEDDMDDMAFNLEPAPKGRRGRKSRTSQKATDEEKAQSEEAVMEEEVERSDKPVEGEAKNDHDDKMEAEEPEEADKGPKDSDVKMAEATEDKQSSELKKRKLDDEGRPPVDGSVSSGSHEAAPKRKRVPIPVPHAKPPPEPKPIVQDPVHVPPSSAKLGVQPLQAPPSDTTGPPLPQTVSRALRINNFVRPFNDKSCRDMLEQHGEIVDMWMPIIKTHCYVVYKTEEQAMKAYKATYNLEWPRGGRKLIPHVVTVLEAQREIDRGRMRGGNPGAGSGELQGVSNAGYARTNSGHLGTGLDARMDRGPGGGQPPYPPAARRAVSRPVTLEDLFFKTHTKPPLYYLPLTDDEVMAKKRQEVKAAMRVEDGRGENNGGVRHEPREGYRPRGPPPHHMNDEKRIRNR